MVSTNQAIPFHEYIIYCPWPSIKKCFSWLVAIVGDFLKVKIILFLGESTV